MNLTRVPRALAILAFAGIFVVGCSDAQDAQQESSAPSTSTVVETPAFEGAWADLFTTVYSSPATTDAQRAILKDGVISDAEYAQVRNDFKQCLEDLGLSVELYPDGGFAVDESKNLSEDQISGDAVPGCQNRTVGSVGLLYEQIRRNPEQQDEATIVVSCLKDRGVVGSSYTPAEYQRDLDAYAGLDWNASAVRTCTQDPLGLLDGTPSPIGG